MRQQTARKVVALPQQQQSVQLVTLPDTPNTRRLAAACKAVRQKYFTGQKAA